MHPFSCDCALCDPPDYPDVDEYPADAWADIVDAAWSDAEDPDVGF